MQAEDRVVTLSLSDTPVVVLYERDNGVRLPVLYVRVRTEYGEQEEHAVIRARRIAEYLTDDLARKKTEVPLVVQFTKES